MAIVVPDVLHEHGDLHDVSQAGAARLEDATHVLEDAAGLRTDVVRPDQLAVLVECELPGDADGIPDSPAMRVEGRPCPVVGLPYVPCVSPQGSTG